MASKINLATFLTTQVLVLVFLGGCGVTFDYSDLRDMDMSGDSFDSSLGREYRRLALFEADKMWDWEHAAQYRDKAILSVKGNAPLPESPSAWRLPPDKVGQLTAASVRLNAVLERDARTALPGAAARAQSRLECWLEQQEENWQPEHIARCQDEFFAALMKMERKLIVHAGTGQSPATLATTGPVETPAPKRPLSFAVFFDFDSTAVLPDSAEALSAVIDAMKGGSSVRIIVGGHADRAGPDNYNMALSRKRAEAVQKALLDQGATAGKIAISAHGESRPRIATPDGAREARNRRVEITVGPAPAL